MQTFMINGVALQLMRRNVTANRALRYSKERLTSSGKRWGAPAIAAEHKKRNRQPDGEDWPVATVGSIYRL